MPLPARFAPLARFGMLLPALAWLLALAFSAWVAAKWYWRIAGPRTEFSHHAAQTDPLAVARDVAAAHLFGASAQPDAGEQLAAAGPGRFSLIGVAANSGRSPGFAILQEIGKPAISVVEGDDVQPGLKLIKVMPQAVELSRGGVRETLRLSDTAGNAIPPAPIANTSPAMQTTSPPATPAPTPQTGAASAPNAPTPTSEE